MLTDDLKWNRGLIEDYTIYECQVGEDAVEKEISFWVLLSSSVERRGDVFPVYQVPEGRLVWLSDWSLNVSGRKYDIVEQSGAGGSLGRIILGGHYVYVLNCAVHAGEMRIFSPARAIRYLPGEWMAVCFHHLGYPLDLACRATFRFTEVPSSGEARTRYGAWSRSANGRPLDDWFHTDYLGQPLK